MIFDYRWSVVALAVILISFGTKTEVDKYLDMKMKQFQIEHACANPASK
jgi:hypothetical protein